MTSAGDCAARPRDVYLGVEGRMEKLSGGENVTLPFAGLAKELVKDGRAIKAADPPDWTGEGGIK